ncbi:MAG TPA: putative glycoside hydrolase [Longimicrobiales bacterium]|nr:putative glycoside hydrolase [Longimicrobiales bacterium]
MNLKDVVPLKQIDVRAAVRDWIHGGRRGYMAAGLLALVAGLFAIRLDDARGDRALDAERARLAAAEQARLDSIAAAGAIGSLGVVPVAKPEHVRALYLNAWAAGSPRKLAKLIDIANRTDINAFVIDVKEGGEISYLSEVDLAGKIGAHREYIKNVRGVLSRLKENRIYPIARIVVFKDPVLAQAKPELAIQNQDGSLWLDNKGKAWVDSYNKKVWDYNIALAREAVKLGFAEVQWDYVRFPDAPRSYLARAVYPAAANRTKPDAIREFMLYAREQLADLDVPVTADVFGLTVTTQGDMGIGQQWEKMVDAVDVILPMVYPSHFIRGNYGLSNPNAVPYRTIRRSMEDAITRSKAVPNAATIRPWLQAFTLGPPRYTPAHVWAQIQAVYDSGLKEWVLWSPGSNYDPAALAAEDGSAPQYAIPGGTGESEPAPAASRPKADGLLGSPVRTDTIR